jgi:hypothetical protein
MLSNAQHALEIGVGKQFKKGDVCFQPFALFGFRSSGHEEVSYENGKTNDSNFTYHGLTYNYKGLGIGLGMSLQYVILDHLTLGIEGHYNYYFDKQSYQADPWSPWKAIEDNYRISRQRITPIIKVGYSFKF